MSAGTRRYGQKPDNSRALAREAACNRAKTEQSQPDTKPEPKEEIVGGTLFAGPWCGEFGWELCSWNPVVRELAKKYDQVIVETQPGMEYLYEFADEIRTNPRKGDYDMYAGVPSRQSDVPAGATHVHPLKFWKTHGRAEFREIKAASRGKSIHPKTWQKFGSEKPYAAADIMCAFRGPKTFRGKLFPEKQYPTEQSIELVRKLQAAGYSVACYGAPDNEYVEGTTDLRGLPLIDLCGVLAKAKLAIGPSSGTIHLASLCGTPHVSWYGRVNVSMDRYHSYWNPFSTGVTFINVPLPSVDMAFEAGIARMQDDTPTLHKVDK